VVCEYIRAETRTTGSLLDNSGPMAIPLDINGLTVTLVVIRGLMGMGGNLGVGVASGIFVNRTDRSYKTDRTYFEVVARFTSIAQRDAGLLFTTKDTKKQRGTKGNQIDSMSSLRSLFLVFFAVNILTIGQVR
jgi:hypothetical protein